MRKKLEQNTSTQLNRKSLVAWTMTKRYKKTPLPVFLLLDLQHEQRKQKGKIIGEAKKTQFQAFKKIDISINVLIIASGGKLRSHFSMSASH